MIKAILANIIDYSVIITLIYFVLPWIDIIIDAVGTFVIKILNDIGNLLLIGIKFGIRCIVYYLIAIIYTFWFMVIFNLMLKLFYPYDSELIMNAFNYQNIFGNNFTDFTDIYNNLTNNNYANYTNYSNEF